MCRIGASRRKINWLQAIHKSATWSQLPAYALAEPRSKTTRQIKGEAGQKNKAQGERPGLLLDHAEDQRREEATESTGSTDQTGHTTNRLGEVLGHKLENRTVAQSDGSRHARARRW